MVEASEHKQSGLGETPSSDPPKLDRLADHTRGLFDDLTSWFELKLQYTFIDYQEQLTNKGKRIAYEIVAGVILSIAVLFGLVALALGLGAWLTHPAWGFLAVMVLLIVAAAIVRLLGKRQKKAGKKEKPPSYLSTEDQKKLSGPQEPAKTLNDHGKDPL